MALLIRATALYLLAGGLFVAFFRENPMDLLGRIFVMLPSSMGLFLKLAWWVVPIFALMFVLAPWKTLLKRLPQAIAAIFLCTLFFQVFTLMKTTLPYAVDFWADPLMANLDRLLHLGTDPWVFTHKFSDWVDLNWAGNIYFGFWLVPALYTPVLLILFDGDEARKRRFFLLYFFVWVGLGNVLALAFMSVGPVFYDRLLGGDSFAPLMAALQTSGVSDSAIGMAQDKLWKIYATGSQEAGSGISAFPSVHIAMVTLLALYLYERSRWLAIIGGAIVALFVFLSVYPGWHYAIDGYFSILAVWLVWLILQKYPAPAPALAMIEPVTRGSD